MKQDLLCIWPLALIFFAAFSCSKMPVKPGQPSIGEVAIAQSSDEPQSKASDVTQSGEAIDKNPEKKAAYTHVPKPATCEGCHARPQTVGLRAYPNQGPPIDFLANDPKAIGSRHYLGKDCAECHRTPPEGATAFNFTHSVPKAGFCLPCHFNQGNNEHRGSAEVLLKDFGNCFSCHKNFDVNVSRNFNAN